jgi:mannose-1-phosphate guanylyltransferase
VTLLHAIVLAGGSGRRLAGLTGGVPKQFCDFGGPRTLLQETLARLAPLAPPIRTAVVVQETHRELATGQLRAHPGVALLAQPADRGTAAGLFLGLAHVLARDPDAFVLMTPSDHGVGDARAYAAGILAARRAAESATAVLLGAEADEPRPDYGWIVPGAPAPGGARRVETFVEKPGPAEAAALRARGAFFSTMVLVARARSLLGLLRRERPALAAAFDALAVLPAGARELHLRRAYAFLPACDLSREILASAPGLAVVRWPSSVGWTDLGTPERVAEWFGTAAASA